MPELPEVETVRRGLQPLLAGRRLAGVEIGDGRLTAPDDPAEVAAELRGELVERVGRRGKYLLFELEGGRTLLVHLRMTGGFRVLAGGGRRPAHLRALLKLDDGVGVAYCDQRRFGTWRLFEPGELGPYLDRRLGPEPLSGGWASADLGRALRGRSAPVKAALLDQRVVAGVGNIYADEALWEARVHPLESSGGLSRARVARLHAAVVAALERGVEAQGASIRDHRGVDGSYGSMQERFAVYGRDGLPCLRCGAPLRKIRVAQRGTHLCVRCTRAPRRR
ncbi:MAG TPA: bifunctional DNA-formamidopyrimidine glycosylase/DNA-(apurinic or apyrimidinic site) lyase [Gaiellales bacterium]|nr:bifunctional DNA-formamidopyrimidine glycosylase/DNA-(apurinic or apyrimidinic site) lyase [Gaiellales bacterium]